MSRLSVLANRPKRMLGALALLLLAVGVAVGSGANFTASSANPSNSFSAGTLAISNTKDDVNGSHAVLTASNMKPGDSKSGVVGIGNSGNITGTFRMDATVGDMSAAPQKDRDFAHALTVEVDECPTSACTTSSPLDSSGPLDWYIGHGSLGDFTASTVRYFKFTVTFPDGGSNGADNGLMGAAASLTVDWSAVQA